MVTVLLALYRGERWQTAQVDSLKRQTHTDFRVLWQDDGGDNHAFGDERFHPGAHQGQHLGASGNFFDLLKQDDAPYTALCDQDDVWHDDRLIRCLSAMHELERAFGADVPLLVHSDCRLIGADDRVIAESFFRHQRWDVQATSLPRLLAQNNATGCTMLMNAPLRRLVAAHIPDAAVHHDWWIALTAAAFGHIAVIDDALVDYRQHGGNAVGASRGGLLLRTMAAAKSPRVIRERVCLTFTMAQSMLGAYGDALPNDSAKVLRACLALRKLPKIRRIRALRNGNFTMQHPLMRLAQYIFT